MAVLDQISANCGCVVNLDVHRSVSGCYCGPDDYCYCYDYDDPMSYEVYSLDIIEPCSKHGGT